MKSLKSLIIVFFVFLLFGSASSSAALSNDDLKAIKKVQVREILVQDSVKIDEALKLNQQISNKGLALKSAILIEGQSRNISELATLAKTSYSRGGFAKFFIGPKYDSLNEFKEQISFSAGRIAQMRQLQTEMTTVGDDVSKQYESVVLSLAANNDSLSKITNKEERSFALFGWLVKLF